MPTTRFSTQSARPMPLVPAISFRSSSKLNGGNSISVQANGHALLEIDGDFAFAFRAGAGIQRQHEQIFRRRLRRIFQNSAFVAHVPDIAVAAVDLFGRRGDRNVALFRVSNGVVPGLDIPFTPWSNDLQLRSEGFVRQFEPDLIVAFAGAAVRDGIRAFCERDFDLALCQQAAGRSKCRADICLRTWRPTSPAARDIR